MILDPSVTSTRIKNTYDKLPEKCYEKHKDKYDYSKVVFKGTQHKVEILCKKCKTVFLQSMAEHLRPKGCPKCAVKNKKSTKDTLENFIKKATLVHNGLYDYSNSIYINSKTKIAITCQKHGIFWQIPNSHTQGRGCNKCALENIKRPLRYSKKNLILKFNEVHNYKYSYNKMRYLGIVNKIEILCDIHGSFYQTAADHIRGCGCPFCSLSGFKKDKPAILYYLKVSLPDKTFLYKIGVTNLSVKQRFTIADLEKISVIQETYYEIGEEAYEIEQDILRKFKNFKYKGADVLSSGNTELFTKNVLSEYNKTIKGN